MMGKKRERDRALSMHYITITLPPRAALTASGASLLACYARRRRGKQPWASMAAEEYAGRGGTLLLVRPAPAYSVRIADWALPFLRKYF